MLRDGDTMASSCSPELAELPALSRAILLEMEEHDTRLRASIRCGRIPTSTTAFILK